jgi:phosphatidylglycerophosphatase A
MNHGAADPGPRPARGSATPAPAVWRNPVHLLAFGFGAGTSRWAPGTAGTLVAVPLFLLMQGLSPVLYLAITAILFGVGVWLCEVATRDLGVHDHPGIVWDEIVGYLLTMAAAPPSAGWAWVIAGFLLFRLFDIAKPWPIRWADRRVEGGFGIMIDDVLAAVYAGLVLLGLRLFLG